MASNIAVLMAAVKAAQMLGISERKFHHLRVTDPDFPKPITLGPRCNRWRVADLQAYVDSRRTVDIKPEPAHLKGSRMPQARELQAA